jgi:hypothetical protein
MQQSLGAIAQQVLAKENLFDRPSSPEMFRAQLAVSGTLWQRLGTDTNSTQ